MSLNLLKEQEGGIKGAIWTFGLIIVIIAIVILLYIFAPDLAWQVLLSLVNFVLGSFNI